MIVIIACVLLIAIFGNAVTSSEQFTARVYTFESIVQSASPNGTDFSSVQGFTFRVVGEFSVSTIYSHNDEHRCSLLFIRITSVKLATTGDKNLLHSTVIDKSKLESAKNEPFLLQLCNKRIERIFIDPQEEISIRNLKKAIAGLFQFQTVNNNVEEMDVCGSCQVTYEIENRSTILKRKKRCKLPSEIRTPLQSEPIFDTIKNFKRQVLYQMDEDNLSELVRATSYDVISIRSKVIKDFGVSVTSTLDVIFKEIQNSPISNVGSDQSVEEAIHEVTSKFKLSLKPDVLYLVEEPTVEELGLNSLQKTIDIYHKFITESQLGTTQSASAFLKILRVVLRSSKEEIIRVLKDKKNEPILNQIMDIFGSAQTLTIHEAILKTYDFKKIKNIDLIERYLWAISAAKKPKLQFIRDFVNIFEKIPANEKLKETMLLTIAALADKLSGNFKEETFVMISNGIAKCSTSDDKCISMHLRALKKLKYDAARSILLHYSLTGSRMVSVNALRAIYNLPRSSWDNQVLKAAEKIYYQKNKMYDSSARAIAIDILIDSNPDYETLYYLMQSLQSNTSYETRKYLLQRLQQAASTNETFDQILRNLMKRQNLFNYDFLAQKGLSNALARPILQSENLNTSIVTINEVSKSVLKRGHVSVTLRQKDDIVELVTLDMFTSGLSSFLWSDDANGNEEIDEPEELIAGIEVTLYGVQMRPFIFFHGHAELMSHIWAGTASEETPIIQALRLFLYKNEFLPLSTGNILTMDLMGGISFELTGRITFSIWNRNAHSFGGTKIATNIHGSISVNTFFIKNELHIDVASENRIEMTSDLDFYDEVLFCLQISQTKTAANYEFEKQQTVLDTNRKVSHRKKVFYNLPGRTIPLNMRNNEMCNSILRKPGS